MLSITSRWIMNYKSLQYVYDWFIFKYEYLREHERYYSMNILW